MGADERRDKRGWGGRERRGDKLRKKRKEKMGKRGEMVKRRKEKEEG